MNTKTKPPPKKPKKLLKKKKISIIYSKLHLSFPKFAKYDIVSFPSCKLFGWALYSTFAKFFR